MSGHEPQGGEDTDLVRFTLASPIDIEELLLKVISAFAKKDPERAAQLANRLVQAAEANRPPGTERTLNLRQAAERSGLSQTHLSRLCRKELLGQVLEGRPRFSEAELDEFMAQERKPGPKPGQNLEKQDHTP